jgi:probable rRNA maturation factor
MDEQPEQSNEPPPETCVTIQCEFALDVKWLETKVKEALLCLGRDNSLISVAVVNDETMSELHLQHSGIEGTTDVLTFDHGGVENTIDADIAVCIDVALRSAETREHSVESELLLYTLHGILHCMGFDDHDSNSHQKIHTEEDRVLQAIGVGAIWSNGK